MDDLVTIATRLRDDDPQQRRSAILQLAKTDDDQALRYLAWVYKNDPDKGIRQLAYQAGQQIRKNQQEVDLFDTYSNGSASYSDHYSDAYDDDYDSGSSYYGSNWHDDDDNDTRQTAQGISVSGLDRHTRGKADLDGANRYDLIASVVMLMISGVFLFTPLFLPYIDFASIPLQNGRTFGQEIEYIKQSSEGVLTDWQRDNTSTSYTTDDIGKIFCRCWYSTLPLLPGSQVRDYAWQNTSLKLGLVAYDEDVTPMEEYFDEAWLFGLVALTAVAGGVLLITGGIKHVTMQSSVFVTILRAITQVIGVRQMWLIGFLVAAGLLFLSAWFYIEAATFIPWVVNSMGMPVQSGYIVGRELGIGFWILSGGLIISLILCAVGFIGIGKNTSDAR